LHEVSLLENVREILQDHAREQHFTQVKKITLEIGCLSGVEPEALRFGFSAVMKGSLAEEAELILTQLEGQGRCAACQSLVKMQYHYDSCTLCEHPFVTVLQGNEMRIKDLVVI